MFPTYGEYTRDDYTPVFEEHPDEELVERAGYMSTEDLVTQLLVAGANLQVYREAEFAAEEDVPDDAPANRMLDRLDAELAMRSVNARIAARRAAIVRGEAPPPEPVAAGDVAASEAAPASVPKA